MKADHVHICRVMFSLTLDVELQLDLTLHHDLKWSLSYGTYKIDPILSHFCMQFLVHFTSVSSIRNTLNLQQKVNVCIGSPKAKFEKTRQFHKDIFKSKDSRYFTMFIITKLHIMINTSIHVGSILANYDEGTCHIQQSGILSVTL